jgi:hypothetical protein
MTSFVFLSTASPTLVSYSLVRRSISSLVRLSSSSDILPPFSSPSACWLPSRRMLRMDTLAFSPCSLATLAICLRRSSERAGTARRTILPSLCGVRPTSDFWMALTIASMAPASNGLTMIIRGSGTVIEASDLMGVGAP